MRLFESLVRRWRSLRGKDAENVKLSEELQFHLEREVEENIATGMSPAAARAAAKASFGSMTTVIESSYEVRGTGWLDDMMQDLRYGLRTLLKQRSFTFVTVLTLGLGIGACTAIFSLVDAVLLHSLPYGEPERLVYLYTPNPHLHLPDDVFGPSNADFFDIKRQSPLYAAMTLFAETNFNMAVGDRPERVGAAKVDEDFFRTLQSNPELGRVFDEHDEQPGNNQVVVISHELWIDKFAGATDILGRQVSLDGRPYKIIGVMPPAFGYPHKSDLAFGDGNVATTQVWVPFAMTPQYKMDRDNTSFFAMARLKPGVKLAEAQAEIKAIMTRLDRLHHGTFTGWTGFVKPFREMLFGPVRPLMWLLLGAVGFVLLIACGNAANLLLARAANRTHELGVRATLGARRGRLVRQMLTESLLLSVTGGAVGVCLAWLFLHALLRLNPGDIPRMQDAALNLRVMGFLILTTLLTSVLFGVLPSLSATRINLAEFLKSGGVHGVMGDRWRIRDGLVVVQVALVVVLLTGAGLLLRSYERVLAVQPGFSESTVAVHVMLSPQYNTPQKKGAFYASLLERTKAMHGVQAAGMVNALPLTDSESLAMVWVNGYPNEKDQIVEGRRVTPGYLAAMQTPLREGRDLTDEDTQGHAPVAIVNEAFAKKFLGGDEALGRQLRTNADGPWSTIVGVAEDVRYESLETEGVPQIYSPLWQQNTIQDRSVYIAVRSSLPEEATGEQVREVMRSLDPSLPVADVQTMSERVTQATARRRFQTTLLTVFSGMSMLLALVGVYGLLAYSVRQRTGEIGLRMALGSSKGGIVRLVLRQGLRLLSVGLLLGLFGAFALTRFLAGFLFGVAAIDPVTFSLVPALLLVATVAACLIPGFKAAAVDPMQALRHE